MRMKLVELDYVFEPIMCETQVRETLLSGVITDLYVRFMLRDTGLFSKLNRLKKGVYLLKSDGYKARYHVGSPTSITINDEGLVRLVYNNIVEEIVND